MSELQVLRPHARELWVQSEDVFSVPEEILDIPGVRYEEYPKVVRVRLPSTVWRLDTVIRWLGQIGYAVPSVPSLLPLLPYSDKLSDVLYPHQRVGTLFLLRNGGGLLADQMGLGKTITSLVAAHRIRQQSEGRPALIVAPKSVRSVWRNELDKFDIPGTFVQLEGTTPDVAKLQGADWIFCHYDIVKDWWSQIHMRRPCVAILDEAHLVRNGRTKRGKAAQLAASAAECRILLTGTPILNRIGEAWHLLSLVTGKWSWGKPLEFRQRYAGAMWDGFGYKDSHPTNQDELQRRLEGVYLRRTVESAGLELPPLTRQVIEVDLERRWADRYADLFKGYDPRVVLNAILRGRGSRKTIKWLGQLRKVTSDAKLQATMVEIDSALQQGESVVCFTWQRKTAERIAKRAAPYVRGIWVDIHGGVSQRRRDEFVHEFQQHGGLLVATIGALSVGVTLTKARVCVMHDLDWVPANMLQAEQRFWRIGQDQPCVSKWIVARGTLDEMIMAAFERKAAMVEAGASDESVRELSEVLSDQEAESWLSEILRWAKEG